MSKHRRRHRIAQASPLAVSRPEDKNLRDGLTIARRDRQYDERRQFDLPPSRMEFSDVFSRSYQETYSRIDGRPAEVIQSMPRNRNNVYMRESNLSTALHDYFQDSSHMVSECERRSRRRRTLFALQRTRKGSGRGKKHRWTELSKVRCV